VLVCQSGSADIQCTNRYPSKIGCSQHQRSAHTEWYFQKVGREQEVVEEGKNRTVWERDELVDLAHDWVELELAYPVKAQLYRALHVRHPNKSAEAIRARARTDIFNQMLNDARLARDTDSVGASSIVAEDRPITDSLNEWKSERLDRLDLEFLAEWTNGKIDAQTIKPQLENNPQEAVDMLQRVLFPAKTTPQTFRRTPKAVPLEGLSGKLRKRHEYTKLQKSYKDDCSKTAKEVMDNTWRCSTKGPALKDVLPFRRELLSKGSVQDTAVYPPPERVHWGIAEMITSDEVTRALRGVKGVAGPDRLSWSQVKGVASERLACLFNIWMAVGRAPSALKEGLTTLIPKVQGSNDPAAFRPITVTSCLTRLPQDIGSEIRELCSDLRNAKGL